MQAAFVRLPRTQAGWADGVRATRMCHGPTHHTSPRDPRGAWGRSGSLASPSQSSLVSSVRDFSGAPLRQAQPLDRSVRAAGFGRRKVGEAWRREGEGGGRRAEGRERRVPRQIQQMASHLPSPKCRARARGSTAAPPPPNSWGSAVFGATSSLTRGLSHQAAASLSPIFL